MSGLLTAAVPAKPQDKPVFTSMEGNFVGEIFLCAVANRETPIDTILCQTEYKAVKINDIGL